MENIIGILGGMGPLATAHFFDVLVRMIPSASDQEHPRILIDSNPKVPDRTRAILSGGPSPVPVIVETAENLQKAGANFLAMPCVTAHHFFDDIQSAIDIPLIHMIRETAAKYGEQFSGKKAGLLATNGTLKAGIFQKQFPEETIITPDGETQEDLVMKAIYGVKGGDVAASSDLIRQAAQRMIQKGAHLLIAGCTEIPVVLRQEHLPVPLLDPIRILAEACLNRLGRKPKDT